MPSKKQTAIESSGLRVVENSPTSSCDSKPASSCGVCDHRLNNVICSTAPEVWKILDQVKIKTVFKPNQIIFYQGNEPLGLYTISSGLVKLDVTSEEGQSHTLRYLGPGAALGYRSLFANENYHATATAVEKAEVCFIPKTTVNEIFAKFPAAAIRILQVLSKDLRMAEQKWTNQMDKEAPERIAEALIFLQEHFAHQNWTRREIAEWAGTTPETVIRTLAQFEKSGLIDQSEGRNIKITNRQKLIEKLAPTF